MWDEGSWDDMFNLIWGVPGGPWGHGKIFPPVLVDRFNGRPSFGLWFCLVFMLRCGDFRGMPNSTKICKSGRSRRRGAGLSENAAKILAAFWEVLGSGALCDCFGVYSIFELQVAEIQPCYSFFRKAILVKNVGIVSYLLKI